MTSVTSIVSAPCQLICEGASDEAFFKRLIASRNITGFEVRCARCNGQKRCGGNSCISDTLTAMFAAADLTPGAIKGILIAVDSDDDPEAEFLAVKRQIRSAKPMHPMPDRLLEIKPTKDPNPAIAIMTIPWADQRGNLDTLLFQSAANTHAEIMSPLEDFRNSTEHLRIDWSLGKLSKMNLRCTIAVSHKSDPSMSLALLLLSDECPFDFGDAIFNNIASYLEEFRQTVTL